MKRSPCLDAWFYTPVTVDFILTNVLMVIEYFWQLSVPSKALFLPWTHYENMQFSFQTSHLCLANNDYVEVASGKLSFCKNHNPNTIL